MQGKGCGDCRGTGYKGRRSIAEILTLNDEIRELIVDKRPIRQIKQAAYENGTRSLRQAALELVKRGATTLTEIKRVTCMRRALGQSLRIDVSPHAVSVQRVAAGAAGQRPLRRRRWRRSERHRASIRRHRLRALLASWARRLAGQLRAGR
jgi:hypothetical protein